MKKSLQFIALSFAIWCNLAAAATVTVIDGEPTVAGSVSDIVIGSTIYNADFFYSGPTHTDIANNLPGLSESDAEDVMSQIGDALSLAGISTVRYNSLSTPGSTFDLGSATLWYEENGTSLLGKSINANSLNWTFIGDANAPLNTSKPFFVELTVVPVPAAVWLFASALAGLGWMRKRQA